GPPTRGCQNPKGAVRAAGVAMGRDRHHRDVPARPARGALPFPGRRGHPHGRAARGSRRCRRLLLRLRCPGTPGEPAGGGAGRHDCLPGHGRLRGRLCGQLQCAAEAGDRPRDGRGGRDRPTCRDGRGRVRARRRTGAPAPVTVRGIDHVGITVASLEAALVFYRDLLGLRVTDEGEDGGPELDAITGLRGIRVRYAELDLGAGRLLEIVETIAPTGTRLAQRPYDPGASHLALRVDDVD